MRYRVILDDPAFPAGVDRDLHVGLAWLDLGPPPACVPAFDAGPDDAGVADGGAPDAGAPDAGPAEDPFGAIEGAGTTRLIGPVQNVVRQGVLPLPDAVPETHVRPVDLDGDPCTPLDDNPLSFALYVPVVFEDLDDDDAFGPADDVVGFVTFAGIPAQLPLMMFIENFNPLVFPDTRNGWNVVAAGEPLIALDDEHVVEMRVTLLPRLEGELSAQFVDGDGFPFAVTAAEQLGLFFFGEEGDAVAVEAVQDHAGGADATFVLPRADSLGELPSFAGLLSVGLMVGWIEGDDLPGFDEAGGDAPVANSILGCDPSSVQLWHAVPWQLKFQSVTDPNAIVPRRGWELGLLGEELTLKDFDSVVELVDATTLPTDGDGEPIPPSCP
jgi:hypothetical protein